MVTVITRTIGSGKDYATFTLAEAAVPTIVGGTDLVAADTAVVFEADAGTYNEDVTFNGGLSTDATRNVTYKAAAGSGHGGDPSAGVIIQGAGFATLIVEEDYTVLDGLHAIGGYAVYNPRAGGTVYRNLICTSTGNYGINCAPFTTIPVAPITIENCVISGASVYNLDFRSTTIAGTTVYNVRNCTLIGTKGIRVGATGVAGSVLEVDALNNLALLDDAWVSSGSGTVTVTGSNNFGGSSLPFPVAIQGSPATITASTAYDPGAGDFALYVGKNGALLDSPNNDVIDGGVGPSVNSDVPTRDILGNVRSGATANPGAFEVPQAPTVLTRTIGSGKDYASFTLAEADVENIGASADLVFENEAIVFEADAGTYNEPSQVLVDSTLVTDVARHVTYKAAPGSDHGGILGAGVFIDQLTGQRALFIDDANTHLIGLGVRAISDACYTRGQGTVAQNCIFESTTSHGIIGTENVSVVAENCVAFHQGNRYGFYLYINPGFTADGKYRNCTAINRAPSGGYSYNMSSAGGTVTAEIVNCLSISDYAYRVQAVLGPVTVTGSNNFGGSLGPFTVDLQGTPYPITASQSYDPGAGDYALYVGKNGALLDSPNNDVIGQGVGPAANSDVPQADILGNIRSGTTANPGAFEVPEATRVYTKTIGPVGRDYASFVLAESDVTNIPTSTDLVNENEAIVFEADAGTYAESVYFGSTLTTDATRNVTYKPAAGSEHGGAPGAGVVINSSNINFLRDDYMILDGMEVNGSSTQVFNIGLVTGATIRNCIIDAATQGVVCGIDAVDIVLENCVLNSTSSYTIYPNAASGTVSVSVRNCTVKDGPSTIPAIRIGQSGTGTISAEFVNCLALETAAGTYLATGTVTVTGSNNFGGSTGPFPVAIQGSPYPITATTDTDPGPGDWAIYDAATGALIDDPDNDVISGGVGPFVNPDVPQTDIRGNPRLGSTTEPGAFVISSPVTPLPPVDTWTPVMVRRNDPVDVYGVLTFGDAYINAVEDTLIATGGGSTDVTPPIPVGTRALWMQLISQTGLNAEESADVVIEVSASQSLTLATLSLAGNATVGNVPGLMQLPVECVEHSGEDPPLYPRVKLVNAGTLESGDVVQLRVVAIGVKTYDTTWS